ncbi:MAG: TonB-dependent receptor [Lewinellaceae bacterium]|nr:TonB-dependent receptor [Lewinellaceae bacterium]
MCQRITLIFLATVLSISPLAAGPSEAHGTIFGKVTDAATGEGLPWANIIIAGTTTGMATDLEGNYEIRVEPGTYTVRASYLGYTGEEQSVTVREGQNEEVNFELQYGIQGEEVIVTAQASGQMAAINQQISSNKIVNVVSAEKMEELPDANAAESIGRLPGISLQRSSGEASKIVVRGLSPKYNSVTINGVKMASTNDFDRSADLSIIQGEMLAGVEVSKSLRADMDADAIGGTIDLRLREAPEGLHYNANAEGAYNDLGSSFNNYKLVGAVSNRFLGNKLGARLQLSAENRQLPSHRFGGNYSSPILFQELDDEGNLTGESSFKLRTEGTVLTDQAAQRERNGGNLTLDFKSRFLDIKLFSLYNRKTDDGIRRVNTYTFIRPNEPFSKSAGQYEADTRLWTHSLENVFKFRKTELSLTLSHTLARHNTPGQSFNFIELSDGADPINQDWLLLRQPSEVLEEFGATHVENSFLQNMSISESELIDKNYDARLDWDVPFTISDKISGTFSVGGKYHRLERESNREQEFIEFQYGAGRPRKEAFIAMFPWIETNLSAQRGISAVNFVDESYKLRNFLDGRYQLGWGATVEQLASMQGQFYPDNQNLYQRDGYQNYFQDYTNSEELFAGYTMAEINIGPSLMILPGIRFEKENTTYQGYHIELVGANANGIRGEPDSVSTDRRNEFFFPSLNLKFKVNDWSFIRGAVYKSTTRPDFRLLSPTVIITENTTVPFTSGNPFLQPAIAWNYDLGFSAYSKKVGLLSLNLFYKEIGRFIFTLDKYFPHRRGRIVNAPAGLLDALPGEDFYPMERLDETHRTNVPFNNFEPASYRGMELSWQTNFWYLPGLLSGLVLDVNFTLLQSETRYPYFEDVVIGIDSSGFFPRDIIGFEYNTRKGRLVDQPDGILNVILGWDYKGFSSRFSFRYQDQTLQSQDSRLSLSDSFYDTFVWADISLKQQITEHLSAFANLTNIGNHIDDYFIRFGGQATLPTNSEQYGFRAQFGVLLKY